MPADEFSNVYALRIADLTAGYGSVTVLSGVTLDVAQGSVVGLLGANGAGKSTLIKACAGMVRASGRISIRGSDVSRHSTFERVRAGLGIVLEGGRCFDEMTVDENLRSGRLAVGTAASDHAERGRDLALRAFPVLAKKRKHLASQLSGGERQMLAVARGMSCGAQMLMLDEPSVGLSVRMTAELDNAVRVMREAGLSLVIAEQNIGLIERTGDWCVVLGNGAVLWDGPPDDLAHSEVVRTAVIGGEVAEVADVTDPEKER